jgi:hypothetical protein
MTSRLFRCAIWQMPDEPVFFPKRFYFIKKELNINYMFDFANVWFRLRFIGPLNLVRNNYLIIFPLVELDHSIGYI